VLHLEEFRFILGAFEEAGVGYTINTDGTYLCNTNLQREFSLLRDSGILDDERVEAAQRLALKASFIAA
jgi:adenosine deaminase